MSYSLVEVLDLSMESMICPWNPRLVPGICRLFPGILDLPLYLRVLGQPSHFRRHQHFSGEAHEILCKSRSRRLMQTQKCDFFEFEKGL